MFFERNIKRESLVAFALRATHLSRVLRAQRPIRVYRKSESVTRWTKNRAGELAQEVGQGIREALSVGGLPCARP